MSVPTTDLFELRAVNLLPCGDGFALVVRTADQGSMELRFPVSTLHQLMRVLPRVDAALHQRASAVSSALLAYPVIDWSAQHLGADGGVGLCLRTDHHVESGFAFDLTAAQRLCADLSTAIAAAQAGCAPVGTAPIVE